MWLGLLGTGKCSIISSHVKEYHRSLFRLPESTLSYHKITSFFCCSIYCLRVLLSRLLILCCLVHFSYEQFNFRFQMSFLWSCHFSNSSQTQCEVLLLLPRFHQLDCERRIAKWKFLRLMKSHHEIIEKVNLTWDLGTVRHITSTGRMHNIDLLAYRSTVYLFYENVTRSFRKIKFKQFEILWKSPVELQYAVWG